MFLTVKRRISSAISGLVISGLGQRMDLLADMITQVSIIHRQEYDVVADGSIPQDTASSTLQALVASAQSELLRANIIRGKWPRIYICWSSYRRHSIKDSRLDKSFLGTNSDHLYTDISTVTSIRRRPRHRQVIAIPRPRKHQTIRSQIQTTGSQIEFIQAVVARAESAFHQLSYTEAEKLLVRALTSARMLPCKRVSIQVEIVQAISVKAESAF